MATQRTAREIIDQAIRENRPSEIFCYVLAGVFAAAGVFVVVWGAATGNGWVAAAGGVPAVLFWPVLWYARQIRKENMAVRLLEVPLSMAKTEKAAAEALRSAFSTIIAGKFREGRE